MHLIVGLGNIGEKYHLTRHNIGFLVIDEMTKNLSTSNINNSNFQSTLLKSGYNLFAKPTTYMNNSGVAVHAIKEYYKIELENIIVIHDDLDLPFGTVKFKIGGGHGGHNGLRSLDSHIGKDYIRVRIGIGKPTDKNDVANYVLSNFSKEELNKLQDIIPHTIKAIEALKTEEIDYVKSKFTLK
ncbi:MAG: aminoacyl-tRNA hydrolase [Arcobacter sp.]|jgi:PTH1 family peptidyl-tRNA hydrolase|uniref:Peptidyl-tRNA hydrolase n=1 Tax=Arcobacter defluvii TaxID=873191 RepID=A0AAE7E5Z0_9BACT|nr:MULTISPECIES: aminoacyl-tRNA hydrolase [Arcobacter]MDY3201501.1 aminoacyl-tRNA hydrolase [Arcobacter sp.]QKF76837.1 peptidyl-tRNA hydrolase [Arcobacter defluvii]RXI33824.1 aminoacyl-tRNA hydrolase [Arcobacter defluvii]